MIANYSYKYIKAISKYNYMFINVFLRCKAFNSTTHEGKFKCLFVICF